MGTTNGILIVGFVMIYAVYWFFERRARAIQEHFSERMEKVEAHLRYWSFYLGPLGEEARMKREAALEHEYERLAGLWESVDKGDSAKLRGLILAAYKAYQDAVSERWEDMFVLGLVDFEDCSRRREHRWEMEREIEKDPTYALKLGKEFAGLDSNEAKSK